MRIVDLEHYPRRSHFEFFKSYAYPYVGMTAKVDVTGLVRGAKARGGSPFLACLYAAARAANEIPEFRQRIVGEQIVEFDYCNTAHTVALPDHTFCNCCTNSQMDFDPFLLTAKACQEEAKARHGFASTQDDETELIFVSCVPWVEFTQVIQPVPVPGDSNPRIVFGKFIHEGEQIKMPLAIQANHALVDGYHIGQFYEGFQAWNQKLEG